MTRFRSLAQSHGPQGILARTETPPRLSRGAAYAVVGWLLIQVVTQVFPIFHLPEWIDQAIVLLILIGFPIALVLAWAFDATPHGIVRTDAPSEGDATSSPIRKRSHRAGIAVGLIGVLIAVAAGGVWWRSERVAPPNRSPDVAQRNPESVIPGSAAGAAASGLRAAIVPPVSIHPESVAVLPFVNESGDKDQQYFSDGLSEDVITALSQFTGLKVINRDSSFQFRDSKDSVQTIASKLGVAHLLEGTVQRLGDQVRISAELVNASDGSTLWSQHYDRPYKDLFALQDAITKSVADALKIKLLKAPGGGVQSDRPPGGSLAAYNDLLQGMFYVQRDSGADMRKAIGYFEAAIRLDPRYALAWAGVAEADTLLAGNYVGGAQATQAWDKARAAVHAALALDPNFAFAHSVNVFILISADHDWARAGVEAQRAYELAPDKGYFALAEIRATLGHARQAVELLQHGLPTDPLCVVCYDYLARYLPALGRFDEAAQASRKALQLQPAYGFGRFQLVYIEAMRGDATAALQAAQQQPPSDWRDLAMATALQSGGDRAAANAALQKLIAKQAGYAAYQIAEIYALRRDPDNLFKWLDRASDNHDPGVALLLTDPPILRYRDDPRFAAFCKQVGLPTTTDAEAMP